jgi:hypothetical protein
MFQYLATEFMSVAVKTSGNSMLLGVYGNADRFIAKLCDSANIAVETSIKLVPTAW